MNKNFIENASTYVFDAICVKKEFFFFSNWLHSGNRTHFHRLLKTRKTKTVWTTPGNLVREETDVLINMTLPFGNLSSIPNSKIFAYYYVFENVNIFYICALKHNLTSIVFYSQKADPTTLSFRMLQLLRTAASSAALRHFHPKSVTTMIKERKFIRDQ